MKRVMIGLVAALGLVFGTGTAAMAGEVNGTGAPTPAPDHASSECVFSGLDTLDAIEGNPEGFNDDMFAMRGNQSPAGKDRYHGVQSYGSIVRAGGKAMAPSPGMACRGNLP